MQIFLFRFHSVVDDLIDKCQRFGLLLFQDNSCFNFNVND